jgi:UDP-N-acetylglucosamine 2-epimerase (non-hydrolysing)
LSQRVFDPPADRTASVSTTPNGRGHAIDFDPPPAGTIDCIVGARPNLMKIAPLLPALRARGLGCRLIHTGQHYDSEMSDIFFEELGIDPPDVMIGVGAGSPTEQTTRIMTALESRFATARPDLIVVVGDVNSTLAAALVAARMKIPLAHVEAGLRSFDRAMPEEINRVLTDQLSDLLFVTERTAIGNLVKEGIAEARIHFVGNVMIDCVERFSSRAHPPLRTLEAHGAGEAFLAKCATNGFGVVTLHRPSNVDEPDQLTGLLGALRACSAKLPLAFTLHPRTRARIADFGLTGLLESETLLTTPPLSYLELLGLMREAVAVITDSGGIQEETTALGVPCLTLRDNTERPITIEEGTNSLVGRNPAALAPALAAIMSSPVRRGRRPELWDGRAAERIADVLRDHIRAGRVA